MGKRGDEVKELIRQGKSAKDAIALGYSESTYYRAKAGEAPEVKGEAAPNNDKVGDESKETGNNVVPVVGSTNGDSSSGNSDTEKVAPVKQKPKARKSTPKARKPKSTEEEGRGKVSNLKKDGKGEGKWRKKLMMVAAALILPAILYLWLMKGAAKTETVEETQPREMTGKRGERLRRLKR